LLQRYYSVGNVDWLHHEQFKKNDNPDFLNEKQRRIINTVIGMSSQVNHDKLKISDIKNKVNEPSIDERVISRELRYMKFKTTKVNGATHLFWEPAKLKKLAK
jgi:hypothetical protein